MHEQLSHLDFHLLQQAVELTARYKAVALITSFAAGPLVYLFALVLLLLWSRPEAAGKHHGAQKAVVIATFSIVLSLAVKNLLEFFYVRNRPFVSHVGLHMLQGIHVDPTNSFPSAHTLVAFAVASSIWLSGYHKLGAVLFLMAAFVGLGRIFAGVHYPSDVLAAVLIACLVSFALHRESSSLKRYLPNF